MKLKEYPQSIANIERALLGVSDDLDEQIEILSAMDADIELIISTDNSLKNETMRKAEKSKLQKDELYKKQKVNVRLAKHEKSRLSIELALLKNNFSVSKLMTQLEIANINSLTH